MCPVTDNWTQNKIRLHHFHLYTATLSVLRCGYARRKCVIRPFIRGKFYKRGERHQCTKSGCVQPTMLLPDHMLGPRVVLFLSMRPLYICVILLISQNVFVCCLRVQFMGSRDYELSYIYIFLFFSRCHYEIDFALKVARTKLSLLYLTRSVTWPKETQDHLLAYCSHYAQRRPMSLFWRLEQINNTSRRLRIECTRSMAPFPESRTLVVIFQLRRGHGVSETDCYQFWLCSVGHHGRVLCFCHVRTLRRPVFMLLELFRQ